MDKQTILDEVVETTEKTLDLIEDQLDAIEEVGDVVIKNKTTSTALLVAGAVLVAVSSAYAGYRFAQKRLTLKYEERITIELEEAKEYYSRVNKTGRYATPESAAEALLPEVEASTDEVALLEEAAQAASEYRIEPGHVQYDKIYHEVRKGPDEEIVINTEEHISKTKVSENVFTNAIPGSWDYDAEVKKRSDEHPYLVTEAEYLENGLEHEQVSFTYFEGDDVLVDAADRIVPDADAIVGEDNLVRWGQIDPKKPDTLYVRNEELETDFQIERSTGTYAEEVLHIAPKDDARRGPRKFRSGDDE